MSPRPQLIIFAKAPRMGAAKTRLARDIGPVHAQRLYRAMTTRITRQVSDPRWDTHLAVSPDDYLDRLPLWAHMDQRPQGSGGLTPRLLRAFNSPGPVCIIGTDCPAVTARDITESFAQLNRAELVLGPADDGGFWSIAARNRSASKVSSSLFEGVRWSSATALSDVAKNVSGRVHYLRTLTDADDLKGYRQAVREARANRATHLF
jgi:rSAM/selenodomain-associated transferase 1